MPQRGQRGLRRSWRWRLALTLVAFALLTTAHQCEDNDGNPIAHDHCWDGTEAAPGHCPPRHTPVPTPGRAAGRDVRDDDRLCASIGDLAPGILARADA